MNERRVQLSVHVRAYVHEAISTRRSARVHLSVRTYAYVRNVCFNRYVRARTYVRVRALWALFRTSRGFAALFGVVRALRAEKTRRGRAYVRTYARLLEQVRT